MLDNDGEVDLYGRVVYAPTPLARLYAIEALRRDLDAREASAVEQLRSVRVPWAEVARALGVTRQGLRKRYAGRVD